ncbi:MAG: hypothetical protein NT141_02780 [candidate division WWE3 bacterium]|nr:hypothetical protein [candidate division WWE3 bacterium]
MDTNTLLIIIIGLLSLNLMLVGVYIALILKEARETIKKVNVLLDTTNNMAEAVSVPVINTSGVLGTLSAGLSSFNFIKDLMDKRGSVSSILREEKGGRNVRTPLR